MEALTSKGHYNISDLNRVCEATDYIANLLQGYGYKVDYSPILFLIGRLKISEIGIYTVYWITIYRYGN